MDYMNRKLPGFDRNNNNNNNNNGNDRPRHHGQVQPVITPSAPLVTSGPVPVLPPATATARMPTPAAFPPVPVPPAPARMPTPATARMPTPAAFPPAAFPPATGRMPASATARMPTTPAAPVPTRPFPTPTPVAAMPTRPVPKPTPTRTPVPTRTAATTANQGDNSDFSGTVDRIVSMTEQRENGLLTPSEMASLSMLCSVQSSKRRGISDDLGFADVDPDQAGQLVTTLQKHVMLASNIDAIRQGYIVIQKIRSREYEHSIDAWLQGPGQNLIHQLRMGLEAASILLFIITSPGIDRRVVNEDAIEASIVLFRSNLNKNMLPSINNVGHIIAASTTTASKSTTSTPSAKRRRRSSAGGGNDATVVRDMKKIYKYILTTVGLTVLVMERLDVLVQKVPLDDQQILNMSSGTLLSLELDPTTEATVAAAKQLHVASISIATSISRKYSNHRQIMLEDIFPVMLKTPTSKKGMRTYPLKYSSSVLYPQSLQSLSQSLVPECHNPKFIQPLSALIIALVQSAVVRPTFDVPAKPKKKKKKKKHLPNVPDGTSPTDIPSPTSAPKFISGLLNCQSICETLVAQLLKRCAKKGEDGGASEFRPILLNFIDDLLLMLLVPEYPAAEMFLLTITNYIIRDLLQSTSTKAIIQNAETTYLNTVFDALGRICAAEAHILKSNRDKPLKLETPIYSTNINERHMDCYCKNNVFNDTFCVSCDKCHTWFHGSCVGLRPDHVPPQWYCDTCQLDRIVEFERDKNINLGEHGCSLALIDKPYCMRRLLIDYLSILTRLFGSTTASAIGDAYSFHLAKWAGDLKPSAADMHNQLSNHGNDHVNADVNGGDEYTRDLTEPRPSTLPLFLRLMELWDPRESSADVNFSRAAAAAAAHNGNYNNSNHNNRRTSLSGMLHCISDEGRCRLVVHLVASHSSLLVSFQSQIEYMVKLMGSDASASLRKLSLKAIEKVADADQKLMLYPFLKKAVVQRFSDEAISVREAAVSLVGSYVVNSPAVANAFHSSFMLGLNDAGVSVRKRTVKILQDILCANPSYRGRAAACGDMLRLAANPKEDDGVRDLIHDLFLRVWLENGEEQVQLLGSPICSPLVEEKSKTPGAYVELVEERCSTTVGLVTPTPQQQRVLDFSSPSPAKETRSAAKKMRSKRLQMRSEMAAEQMVEVVKAAGTHEHLTILFRELLAGVSDADKDRKASERKKRQKIAQSHCSMLVDAIVEILLSAEEKRSKQSTSTSSSSSGFFGTDLVAITRTINVFSQVSPANLLKHVDTFLPYFKADNGLRVQDEETIVSVFCNILTHLTPVFQSNDVERLGHLSLPKDLVNITYKFGPDALSASIEALCSIAYHNNNDNSTSHKGIRTTTTANTKNDHNHDSPFRRNILDLAKTFYKYLKKYDNEDDIASKTKKIRANIQRALSVLGSICRYSDNSIYSKDGTAGGGHRRRCSKKNNNNNDDDDDDDDEDDDSDDESISHEDLELSNLPLHCKHMFEKYLHKNDTQTRCAALRALSGLFIACPREMLLMDQVGLISNVMGPDSDPRVQLESLRCWCDILLTEEARIESGEAKRKMEAKQNITLSKKISGDQDADATLFGGVLTGHAGRLFQLTQIRDKKLRLAALELIGHLLRQGQVNPNEAMPYLLALQGDVEEVAIRSLALKLLMVEGEKRPDMLRQRVRAGVKQAYAFQKFVYPDLQEVSALVRVTRNGTVRNECVFASVFKECISSIKKQRQGLFRNLLALFQNNETDHGEWSRNESGAKGASATTPTTRKKTDTPAKAAAKASTSPVPTPADTDADTAPAPAPPTGKPTPVKATALIDGEKANLPLLSYTSQVLAYLPYTTASDPLYIIHHITSTLALQGPDLIDRLASFLRVVGLANSDDLEENNLAEDCLEIAAKRSNPRHAREVTALLDPGFDIKGFSLLCCEVAALTLLMRLKMFLREAYNLSETRCLSYNPDAKDRAAEKLIPKMHLPPFNSKLAMRTSMDGTEAHDLDGMIIQYAEFRQLMRIEATVDVRSDDEDDYDYDVYDDGMDAVMEDDGNDPPNEIDDNVGMEGGDGTTTSNNNKGRRKKKGGGKKRNRNGIEKSMM